MRIGILGGTFDPIHIGHIQPALDAYQQLQLDNVWLMPNHIPPHKSQTSVSTEHRLNMVKQVCQQFQAFELCDIEATRNAPSYSVTTLKLLKQKYPQHTFYFIMGMDSFINLPSWYNWQSLFNYCHIALCARPGWQLPADSCMQQQLNQRNQHDNQQTGQIHRIKSQLLAISSTEIRARIQHRNSTDAMLMPYTAQYIQQHQLYGVS
ncbi:nicotinate-nucleotide adenylyltransferase [Shewanella intestini]|uniref:Probable nicotinate-nucleotide adenylyltransferase n=1 Tax=Shewanella intestini TaxID=2017544 RepID=A0ABS5I5Z6_9GAMM|nr:MULTISPECIES: nicotinate-nucleotide adenylyltransferase [Shewanella]MBR9729442.1 nicotinate-nucleotide adenylyltransferase [Shewanella intestini]MRG35097.1 nicotinate-nucleotide adenylyltransferase [Shewanella sp. XMDDZSB0408]